MRPSRSRRSRGPSECLVLVALVFVGCGEDKPNSGIADPLRPATGTVVATIRQHFTGEVGVGFPVTLRGQSADTRSALTNQAGEATFLGVAVGDWELTFAPPPGFVPWAGRPPPATVSVVEGQTVRHVFEYVPESDAVARGDLSVAAREETLGGFAVEVPGTRIRAESDGGITVEITVERGDLGRIEDLPVGRYTVTVEPPQDYALAAGESGIRVAEVVETYVVLVDPFWLVRTDGTGGIVGWIGKGPLGPAFVPATGATVGLRREGQEAGSAAVGADGFYVLEELAPGSYELVLTLPQGWTVQAGAALPADVSIVTNRLQLLDVYALDPPG